MQEKLLAILHDQVKPALGCTEPVAVGLAAATALARIPGTVLSGRIRLSRNIFKNAHSVGIPGARSTGIEFATALALVCGDPAKGLELLAGVTPEAEEKALSLKERITVALEEHEGVFFIEAVIATTSGEAVCTIRDFHTNITEIKENGRTVFTGGIRSGSAAAAREIPVLGSLTFAELIAVVEKMPPESLAFLKEGAIMNMAASAKGLETRAGLGLGAALRELMHSGVLEASLANLARMEAAAASDARMAGLMTPVMSSAGSGNHGITAIVPVVVVARERNCPEERLLRALALSHLVTFAIKEYSGKLSPVCGCAIAAGAGATAAISWLLGLAHEQIAGAVASTCVTLSGLLCDGGKPSCAFKIATAATEAVINSLLARNNAWIREGQGIAGGSIEETIRNIGYISQNGMNDLDSHIVRVLVERSEPHPAV